jgi:uncharacterized protein YjbI with pentapeptide repeats
MQIFVLAFMIYVLPTGFVYAEQDMLLSVDLTTPNMAQAEMSRADIEAMIDRASGTPLDLSDKRLSGLDLSGLDLRGANLRLSRLNKTVLRDTDLSGANLDQAWLLHANLSGAKLVGTSLFGAQVRNADLSHADLTRAKSIGDFRGANLSGATLIDLKGGADMKNQSMGLMRTVFTSANLEGANLRGADLGRARLDFAILRGADLTDAILTGSDFSGADVTGATIAGADFTNVDVSGAKLRQLKGEDKAKAWGARVNADRALTQPTQ